MILALISIVNLATLYDSALTIDKWERQKSINFVVASLHTLKLMCSNDEERNLPIFEIFNAP